MEYKTVTLKETEFDTEPPVLKEFDYEAVGAPFPHPGLCGKRVKSPDHRSVYLVWNGGYKCWIPNPATYDAIFRDWEEIVLLDTDQLAAIATGPSLTSGALMVRPQGLAPVYLVTNGTKNWVTSPKVMEYCHFRWPTGNAVVPPILMEFVPNGIHIDYGD